MYCPPPPLWCGVDTAASYRNESALAEGLSLVLPAHGMSPQDIFITSKLGVCAASVWGSMYVLVSVCGSSDTLCTCTAPKDHGYESALSAVRQSLKQLQRNSLDLYLVHWPGVQGVRSEDPRNRVLRRESWAALETMYRQGQHPTPSPWGGVTAS